MGTAPHRDDPRCDRIQGQAEAAAGKAMTADATVMSMPRSMSATEAFEAATALCFPWHAGRRGNGVRPNVDASLIASHWDSLVRLTASVMSGHASAVAVMARFGSAARSDPIYAA